MKKIITKGVVLFLIIFFIQMLPIFPTNNASAQCTGTCKPSCTGTETEDVAESWNCPGADLCCIRSCTVSGVTGTCMDVSLCAGTATPGYCPGPANIQCCTTTAPTGGFLGGIVPCGPGTAKANCTICDIFKLIENLINFLMTVSFSLAAIMVSWGAFLFFTARGNPQQITQARGVITTAVIGIIIVLSAWTVINTIILFFTVGYENWYSFTC
jgi:hypothetical protein